MLTIYLYVGVAESAAITSCMAAHVCCKDKCLFRLSMRYQTANRPTCGIVVNDRTNADICPWIRRKDSNSRAGGRSRASRRSSLRVRLLR